ncbi:hypothetical protein PG993_002852 [Apiospora rasikravindrae]|uniref:Uncharacterized protein n=1 Tax=Apiospora rasikravindrae TaxID=990691 RepID=A0ABR1TXX3_9PEZI
MHGIVMSMGALALSGMASAARLNARWTYPDCDADNCYRAFIDKDHIGTSPGFCWDFLTTPHKDATGVPQEFANCDNDVKRISSACSCITYTYSHSSSSAPPTATTTSSVTTEVLTTSSTPSTTTPTAISSTDAVPASSSSVVPVTSSNHSHHVHTTSTSSSGPSASVTASTGATDEVLTTSTVTKVHSYTVTSCAKTVVDCPATTKPYVTVETSVYVTTCPVSSGKPKPTPETESYPASSYPIGSITSTLYATSLYTVTKCPPHVHNCPASSTYVTSSVVPTGTTVLTCPVAVSTSTLYATSQITLTKCPPSVHNCPASSTYITSSVVPTGTVVVTYPVISLPVKTHPAVTYPADVPTTKEVETSAPYAVTTPPKPQQSYGYGGTGAPISPPKPTSSYLAVPTAAAGRVEIAGVAAVIGGVLAAIF